MAKPLSLYLVSTCFNNDMVSDFPLLLHDWTDLKSIWLDFMCRKNLPSTKKRSMAFSTFWWCLNMIGGKVILGMVLWCSGLLIISLTCMMGIWGPYMAYVMLILSVVIGKFPIRLFWTASFKVCVEGNPTSCCSIIALPATLIYCMWNHNLLLYMVLRKV